ncbi:hypothetical protein JCM8547_002174 [Rhodosporidiobolus lusitaniae]
MPGPIPLRRLNTTDLSSSFPPSSSSSSPTQPRHAYSPAPSDPQSDHSRPNAHPSASTSAGEYCSSPVALHHDLSSPTSGQNGTAGAAAAQQQHGGGVKSRLAQMSGTAGSSPTQTHASLVARRNTGGSPAQSMSMTSATGGGGAVSSPMSATVSGGGSYIGGGFAGGRGRRGSFSAGVGQGRRWWTSRGRATKVVILLVAALALWGVAKRWRAEEKPRQKLLHRWWEAEETPAEDLSALLPRPTLPPRPPRPKPPPSFPSHTLSQLLKLPSTVSFSSSSTPDWTAVLHLTSSSQLLPSHLQPLLASFARQTPPPTKILILAPSGLEPSSLLASFGPVISIASYPPQQVPVVALAHAAQSQVASDYILFVDGNLPASSASGGEEGLPKDYVRTLLHASGMKEYSPAILTAGGLSLSSTSSPSSPHFTCHYPSLLSSPSLRTSTPLTLPSLPFLLPTSWLLPPSHSPSSSLLQGLSLTLPLEAALSAALHTKHAVPVFAIPIPLATPAGKTESVDGWACERLRRSLVADPGAAALFVPENGGGEGIRRLRASGERKKGGLAIGGEGKERPKTAAEEADEARSELLQRGTVVVLLSGREELEQARAVACRWAGSVGRKRAAGGGEGGETDLKVVVADYDVAEAAKEEARSSSSSAFGAGGAGSCHLELTPLGSSSSPSSTASGSSSTSEPISLALVDLLDSLIPAPAFVLYLSDGPRAREFEEVLRWMGGVFGPRKGGAEERWSRVRAERELLKGVGGDGRGRGRATVVGMKGEEVRRAEWLGALELEALRHWHTPRLDLSIVTNDRPVSFHRLLSSLQTASYYGDDVTLAVNLEQTADRLTHRLVDDLRWPHGTFTLRHRILLGTLMPAIVESWYPTSNDTYGVLLEDDIEVSPLFYGWLKFTILQYRYTLAGRRASSRLFGVSLYQQKMVELRPEGRQPFDAHKIFADMNLHSTSPYLSQIPCSWGAAYFPEVWREFHAYLGLRLSEVAFPISERFVPAIRSNNWPRSWKKYFIELAYLRGYAMLYPNFPNFESLSTNHLEKGTHVHTTSVDEKKKAFFRVPLLEADDSLIDTLPGGAGHERLPLWSALPTFDLWAELATPEEILERGWQTTRMMGSCATLPDLTSPPRFDARELLCRRTWDRETEGRLVHAQGLGDEQKQREEEEEEREGAAPLPPPLGAVGEVDAPGRGPREQRDARPDALVDVPVAVERAFYPAPPAGRPAGAALLREPRAVVPLADSSLKDDEEENDARPSRPQHDHLHEDASIAESELDDYDAGKRGALFDAEGEEVGVRKRKKGRKAVDLEARERLEEEAEFGLDEDEQREEGEEGGGEEEGEVIVEKPKKVRWQRADD